MKVAILTWLLIVVALPAFAEPEDPADYEPSEALVELFETLDDDEQATLITPEERAYFDALPERVKLLFDEAIEYEVMTEPVHLETLLSLGLRAPQIELLMQDFCIVCHSDPWQDAKSRFAADPETQGSPAHMNLLEFTNDVHFRRGVSCAGCHGGDPNDVVMTKPTYESMPEAPGRHEDRSWIPDFCARCHSDGEYMNRFDPNLPTDQYSKYVESRHGMQLLKEGDSKAAQCVSCHGAHGIRSPKNPRSTVYPRNVPEMCGKCHADADTMAGYTGSDGAPLPTTQLEQYRTSIHGVALLEKGDLGAPACNDCHGGHRALPRDTSTVAQVCRECHAGNGELFDNSKHKKAFESNGWPECSHCHGTHAVSKADDTMLAEETNLLCYECHREYAKENPDCDPTAKYFHTAITGLAEVARFRETQIEDLAERGLDTEPLSENTHELGDVLRQARSRIHAFDKKEFEKVELQGQALIEQGVQLIDEAEADYRFRRNGLLVAVMITFVLALLIGLKIRDSES